MSIAERVTQDITAAMRARDEHRLSTLRMVKSALKNKEIEKRSPLDDQESMAVLNTLIKQRKDSIEQFTKGRRPELAEREAAEIRMIEGYLPQAASEEEIASVVRGTITEMGSPTMKDMGAVMKSAMAKFASNGTRVDGKIVSETVKRLLSQA
ncbi:MAG TPA: GatB/YqeY domain-containing protein [Terriglobales bacterium]|nr:GatB/YqeY domain-containing protein [Terriglobales bacterium]